ncbi:MAG: TolC family protein [Bacteroidales bacterium]|jgi:outer membrane protein
MNKRKTLISNLPVLIIIAFSPILQGQESHKWTLREAIDYARENNIQVQSQQISKSQSELGLEQAKAALFPSLSFSSNQSIGFSNTSSYNEFNEATGSSTYNGSYSLNSGVTLFAGGKLRNNIKQKEIQDQASGYDVEQARTDIEVSVTQAYLQILYSHESVKIAEQSAELSKAQAERALHMYNAGSISKADLASLQAQAANDEYQIISSQTSLSSAKLQLKQLLELDMAESFEIDFPEINDSQVLASIPSLETVYNTALSELPQMKSSALSIEAADIAVEIARAAKMPTVSMSAGVSTSSTTASPDLLFDQLSNKINENVGININVPIFNGKQAKINVNNARQQSLSARLQDQNAKKNLLSTIESLYNDALSAQSKYISANKKLDAAKISYDIVTEQFNSGLKNTVELITERNNYLNAQGNQLQAKYQAVLALKLLNVYQNQPVTL